MSVSLPSLGLASETCSLGCPWRHLPWHLGKGRGKRGGVGHAGWLNTGDNGPLWPTGEGTVSGSL